MASILEAYASERGARLMDEYAKTVGLPTLSNLSEKEVIKLLPEETDLLNFYEVLWEACLTPLLERDTTGELKVKKRHYYKVAYRGHNRQTYYVRIHGYSAAQVRGYICSGKCPISKYVDDILSIKEIQFDNS